MLTLLDLLMQDGFTPKFVANTSGGEYAGPCPRCGGTDRFRIWPNDGRGGRSWCRECDGRWDTIQYLRDFRNLSFAEAMDRAGWADGQLRPKRPQAAQNGRCVVLSDLQRQPSPKSPMWQRRAVELVQWSQQKLMAAEEVREWLHRRGLSDQTILDRNLGFVARSIFQSRSDWGLPIEYKENGQEKRLWIPGPSVLIPCRDGNGQLTRVRFRRLEQDDKPKYIMLPGSSGGPMVPGEDGPIWMVVESELDGLLVSQEVPDLVVVGLGSAAIKPDEELSDHLSAARLVLVALDNDEAGYKARDWWLTGFQNARDWPAPRQVKDIGDAYQSGLNVRRWVQAGIKFYAGGIQPPAELPKKRPNVIDLNRYMPEAI